MIPNLHRWPCYHKLDHFISVTKHIPYSYIGICIFGKNDYVNTSAEVGLHLLTDNPTRFKTTSPNSPKCVALIKAK